MKPLKQGPTPQPRTNRQRKPYAQKKIAEQNPNQNKPGDPVPVKKSRASKASPTPIQCLTCKQTDVPLILGGSVFYFFLLFFFFFGVSLHHQDIVVLVWMLESGPPL